jgi:hypothetical protein
MDHAAGVPLVYASYHNRSRDPQDLREGTQMPIYEQLVAEWAARRAATSPMAADLVTLVRVRDGLVKL